MSLFLAFTAAASLAAGINAQCVPLGEAATDAGLTALVDTITAVAELPGAQPLLDAATASEPVDEPITVFAPTNRAFEAIADVVATLSTETIVSVLANHVVGAELPAAAILQAIEEESPVVVESLLGLDLLASLSGQDLIVSPADTNIQAKVVTTDVFTCAGVVHVVDAVLVPAFPEMEGGSTEMEGESPGGEYGEYGAYGAYGSY